MSRALAIDARLSFATGIGTYLRELLARGVVADFDRDLFVLDPPSGELPIATGATPIERVPVAATLLSPREQLSLPRLLRGRADALWVPHLNIPLAWRGPLAVTLHDIARLDGRPIWRDRLWYAYGRVLLRTIARDARVVLCDSEFTRTAFRDFTGCDPDRVRVVPLGVSEEWFEASADPAPRERPYFLYLGNLKRHKNVTGLLRAFASVRDRIDCDLVIAGPYEGLRSLDRDAAPLARSLGARVKWLGWIPEAEATRWVAGARALVLPSFSEGFGLPPLEAMAAGRAVLVSRAGALPETCGDAALYCDPHDQADMAAQLVELATCDPLVDDLGQRGRAWARRFRWEHTVRETRAALEALF